MSARHFNWKEVVQLIGGVALLALIQAGLLLPDRPEFIGSWLLMAIFGAVYAVLGGVTGRRLLEKQRQQERESDTDA